MKLSSALKLAQYALSYWFLLVWFFLLFCFLMLSFSPSSAGYLLEFTKKPSQKARSCDVIKVTGIAQPLLFSLCLKKASSGEEQ